MARYVYPRPPRRSTENDLLQEDVAAMISDTGRVIGVEADELARDIVTVVRERVLRDIASIARKEIR